MTGFHGSTLVEIPVVLGIGIPIVDVLHHPLGIGLASDLRSFDSLVVAGPLVAGDLVTFLGTSVLTCDSKRFFKS